MQVSQIKGEGEIILKQCSCQENAGIDIFNGKKYDNFCSIYHKKQIPYSNKTEYQLIDITEDGHLALLSGNGDIKEDLMLPNDEAELSQKIREDFSAEKDLIILVSKVMG